MLNLVYKGISDTSDYSKMFNKTVSDVTELFNIALYKHETIADFIKFYEAKIDGEAFNFLSKHYIYKQIDKENFSFLQGDTIEDAEKENLTEQKLFNSFYALFRKLNVKLKTAVDDKIKFEYERPSMLSLDLTYIPHCPSVKKTFSMELIDY